MFWQPPLGKRQPLVVVGGEACLAPYSFVTFASFAVKSGF